MSREDFFPWFGGMFLVLWHVSDVATKLKQFHVVKQHFFWPFAAVETLMP